MQIIQISIDFRHGPFTLLLLTGLTATNILDNFNSANFRRLIILFKLLALGEVCPISKAGGDLSSILLWILI